MIPCFGVLASSVQCTFCWSVNRLVYALDKRLNAQAEKEKQAARKAALERAAADYAAETAKFQPKEAAVEAAGDSKKPKKKRSKAKKGPQQQDSADLTSVGQKVSHFFGHFCLGFDCCSSVRAATMLGRHVCMIRRDAHTRRHSGMLQCKALFVDCYNCDLHLLRSRI